MSHFTTIKELMRPVKLIAVFMFASTLYGWNYNFCIIPYLTGGPLSPTTTSGSSRAIGTLVTQKKKKFTSERLKSYHNLSF